MSTRVLHIFSPNFKQRFGGPIYNWGFYFSKWTDARVQHLVLDTETGQILEAKAAFNFELGENQQTTNRWGRLSWIFRLYRYIQRFRNDYDMIHFHLIWWGSLIMVLWAKRHHIPTIYESVLLGSDTPSGMREESFGRLKIWFLRRFTRILTISDGIAEDYLANGFSPVQIWTQMNCIDLDLFHPLAGDDEKVSMRIKFNLPEDALVCLFAGSLIKRKGLDLLIPAFIDVAERHPDIFLWLVGPQNQLENPTLDESFIDQLKQQIKAHQLEDHVRFEGLIRDRVDMAAAFQAADIFVFPSRKEGLPNVVLEAMACGLPVIVSDLPGLKNVIENGNNGIVVALEEINTLNKAIESIISNDENRVRLGVQARQYILNNHNFQGWQASMTEHYRTISHPLENGRTDG